MILPLIINNRAITNFREKPSFSVLFFALQCAPIINDSKLQLTAQCGAENRLTRATFKDKDVFKIIRSRSVNKAHGHDDISIRLHKFCDVEVVKPLSLIFKSCVQREIFPNLWKKLNIVPDHKKGDKQCMVNYRPVLLFPICSKIFEKIILIQF